MAALEFLQRVELLRERFQGAVRCNARWFLSGSGFAGDGPGPPLSGVIKEVVTHKKEG